MTPHDEALEAAAIALIVARREQSGMSPLTAEMIAWLCTAPQQQGETEAMSAAITAYLRHMRAAGYVVTKVPEPEPDCGLEYETGYNACRAEMLANAVEVRDET